MGACVDVRCAECKEVFIISPHMLGTGVDFHCPFCDAYFKEEDSPEIKE